MPPNAARKCGRCASRSASLNPLRSLRSAPTQNAFSDAEDTTTARTELVGGQRGRGGGDVAGHRGRQRVVRLRPVEHQLGHVAAVAVPAHA